MLFLIEPIDDQESSNEMNKPRDSKCKKDSDCLKGEICSIISYLKSMPPQPVYGCVKPNGNPKSPKQGIKWNFDQAHSQSCIKILRIRRCMIQFHKFLGNAGARSIGDDIEKVIEGEKAVQTWSGKAVTWITLNHEYSKSLWIF